MTKKCKNFLFGATNIVTHCDKGKYLYCRYGITFYSAGSLSFDNGFARNVIIFDVDNSSWSHSGSGRNNLLILGEGQTLKHIGFHYLFTKN